MRALLFAALLLPLVAVCCPARAAAAAPPRIEFELVTGDDFPLNGARRWIELFTSLQQTNVRIRGARGDDRAAVRNRGSERSPSYHVVGLLTGNRLHLTGGRFRLSDRAGLAKWIETLQNDGIDGLTAVRVAFGLTSEQLLEFHERLKKPLTFATRERRAGDVARQIVQGLNVEFDVTPPARAAFRRQEVVADELNGLTSGTALAAVLRPLGLVAAPRKEPAGKVSLVIADVRELKEAWPIGWPSTDSPFQLVPELFENVNVEIRDTALSEAIAAIQPRVKLPFLFDYNAMARHEVEPTRAQVEFPPKRASYKKILDTILFQGGLRSELRVDEAGTPFLWISTTKQ